MFCSLRKLALFVAVTALVACSFDPSGVYFPEGGGDSSGPDAGNQPPDQVPGEGDLTPLEECEDWSPRHFDACALPYPGDSLELSAPGTFLFDTDTGALVDPLGQTLAPPSALVEQEGGPGVRVLSVRGLVVGEQATLRLVGGPPLVVASWSTIEVLGEIDASSHTDSGRGAGSEPAACESHAPEEGADSFWSGGGGGGGAGFGESGGRGGNGAFSAAGAGGDSVTLPSFVRGGCAGAQGGAGWSLGGQGGSGGGALYLVARREIAVHGAIVANGCGGSRGDRALFGDEHSGPGGDNDSAAGGGGGGGGSGGMIGLEAPTVVFGTNAAVTANGAGAGEGGDADNFGAPGSDGLAASEEAPGGSGLALQGGDGGGGGFDLDPAGNEGGGGLLGGGGGGGGGVGFVILDAGDWLIPVSAVVTPRPVQY